MVKNSFTLFETLISIVLLSIVIVGISRNSYYDNFDEEYMLLNDIENSFSINTYDSNFLISSENLEIIKNDIEKDTILVNKIKYQNNKIEILKYDLQ